MSPLSFEMSLSTLLYLASVAAASLIVAGAGLAIVASWRGAPLPLRHALLLGTLLVTTASPLLLAAMWQSGLTVFQLPMQRDPFATLAASAMAGADLALSKQTPLPPGEKDRTTAPTLPSDQFVLALMNRSPSAEILSATVPASERWSWSNAGRVVAAIWGFGCVVSLLLLLVGLARVWRMKNSCRQLADEELAELMSDAARSLNMRFVPPLFATARIDAPLSWGVFRPRVVVPEGAVDALSREQLRGLLAHELAHVARHDHLIGLLQRTALVLFWWNPLVHRLSGNIATLREEICDDLATSRDSSCDGYAAMLVELASRAVSRRPLPTAIGMFDGSRSEFSRRVERLLEDGRSQVTSLDRRMKLVSGAICLALLVIASLTSVQLQADAAESKVAAAEDQTPAVEWPKVLRGTIRDEKGKSVAGAKVRLDVEKIHEFKIGRWDETLSSQEMTTGADGEYRFDTTKYPEMKHRPFCLMMTVTANGFADAKTWNWYSNRDTKLGEKWNNVKLVAGRVVRGRVMTDYGVPVAGAVIKAAGDFEEYTRGWSWDPRKSDEDGNFSISVPSDLEGPIELWVVSRDWAPQRAVLPKKGTELADIRLQRGAPVKGQVTSEDGSPVSGAVVKAESVDDGTFNGTSFPVNVAAKTGADGRYELPPLAGIYKMYLSQAEESDDRLVGRFVVADGPVPLAAPVKVAVSGGEPQTADFRAGPGVTVSGTIRWADGRPVADCEVKASYLPPDFGTGIWIDMVHTDKEGRYELRLPKPIDNVSVNVTGEHDANRVWHSAFPADDAPAKQKSEQFAALDPLDGDLAGVDWVLKSEAEREPQPAPPALNSPATQELSKLERRYNLRQQELREALDQATTPEEKARLQLERDPRVLLADDYLALEEKNRGTDVGLAALTKLEQMAASVGDMMPKLPAARSEMYRRLSAHYLSHPDLDLMFRGTSAGPRTAEGPDLLHKAAAESPYDNVKAAAIYQLACYEADLADNAELVGVMTNEFAAEKPQVPGRMEALAKAAESLRGVDSAAARKRAVELAKRIELEFSDVREPERVFEFNGMFHRQPAGATPPADRKPTYGELAKGLLFDLERLQVGMPAPDVTTEKDGKPVYATQYLGKVTMLVFDYSYNEPLKQGIAEWAKQHAGKPLDVLLVQTRVRGDTSESKQNPAAPLQVVDEAEGGPIATAWGIRRWPTIFVVDCEGTIRARKMSVVPTQLVNELLKSAPPQ